MFIINHKKIFLAISLLLMISSGVVLAVWGLPLGIDFTGGSLLEVRFSEQRLEAPLVREALQKFDLGNVSVQPLEEKAVLIRMKDVNEETHREILKSLGEKAENQSMEEIRFESVGPIIGQELKEKAVWAIAFVLLMIVVYITYAFRGASRPVSSWRYGLAAIIALFHDVLITTGVFSVLALTMGKEADLLFVTALLTILGFSVHDTIVVFDRIRENLRKGSAGTFAESVGFSLSQTFTRSVLTSFSTLLALFAVFFWGGASIKDFSLVLIVGMFLGTYSSLFIASPLLVLWQERAAKSRNA